MGILLSKDVTQLLIEASQTEDFLTENTSLNSTIQTLEEEVNYLEEATGDIKYTEDMIPVIMQESTYGPMYLVEYDMLTKLMESTGLEADKALDKICEHNEISTGDTYVLIESAEYILEELKQFKKEASLKAKKDIQNASKTLQDLKDKGIKLVTKKSNKKKRKK